MNSWPVFPSVHGIIPNKTRVIIIYPTVDPQIVVVPIVSSIFIFPIIVFLVICWLRKRAAKRRQKARLSHRDDLWNERSCASIVQRSPPLSLSIGNGNGSSNFDVELATTTLDVEVNGYATTQLSYPNNNVEEAGHTSDPSVSPKEGDKDDDGKSLSQSSKTS